MAAPVLSEPVPIRYAEGRPRVGRAHHHQRGHLQEPPDPLLHRRPHLLLRRHGQRGLEGLRAPLRGSRRRRHRLGRLHGGRPPLGPARVPQDQPRPVHQAAARGRPRGAGAGMPLHPPDRRPRLSDADEPVQRAGRPDVLVGRVRSALRLPRRPLGPDHRGGRADRGELRPRGPPGPGDRLRRPGGHRVEGLPDPPVPQPRHQSARRPLRRLAGEAVPAPQGNRGGHPRGGGGRFPLRDPQLSG